MAIPTHSHLYLDPETKSRVELLARDLSDDLGKTSMTAAVRIAVIALSKARGLPTTVEPEAGDR